MKLGCDAIAPRTDLLKKATKRAFTQTSRAENFGNAQRQREWHEDAQIFYCLLPPVFQVPRLAKKGLKKKKSFKRSHKKSCPSFPFATRGNP